MSEPMSNPAAAQPTDPAIDSKYGLIIAAADHLVPLFRSAAADIHLARRMALDAINAYEPQSRADTLSIARTIAFSMAALALIGAGAASDLPLPQKLRVLGRANALNRSADQTERVMLQRRRHRHAGPPTPRPNPPAETKPAASTPAEPTPDDFASDDAYLQAAIGEAMKEYLAARAAEKAEAQSAAAPKAGHQAAIRHGTPAPATAHPSAGQPAASLKAALLRQTALHHMNAAAGVPRPAG